MRWRRWRRGWRRLFKSFYAALFHAFRRHGLEIGLLASDQSALPDPESAQSVYPLLDWIKANMDNYVGVYGTHWYTGGDVDDLGRWAEYNRCFSRLVQHALTNPGRGAETIGCISPRATTFRNRRPRTARTFVPGWPETCT